jgi:enoyl-CoA hydratase/carnithine racemase
METEMTKLADYQHKYQTMRMERTGGILQLTFHSNGGPLIWGHIGGAHAEFANAFGDIARDPENKVVIMTGTGDIFSGPPADKTTFPRGGPESWEIIRFNGLQLTMNLLDIPAPVISCINGPAYRHAEIPLLADIVLAADDALIQDSAHFPNRTVPGDGVNLFFPLLMGWNRGRYFLLTGQTLDASRCLDLGLVNEVMERDKLLPRAWELAHELLKQNPLVLRYTRLMLTAPLRSMVQQYLGHGLALEALAAVYESTGKVGYNWD